MRRIERFLASMWPSRTTRNEPPGPVFTRCVASPSSTTIARTSSLARPITSVRSGLSFDVVASYTSGVAGRWPQMPGRSAAYGWKTLFVSSPRRPAWACPNCTQASPSRLV